MSLFKKSLIWIEGDEAQLVERRTSNVGAMVRTPTEAILLGDSLKSIGKKSVCFHCIISSQRWFIVSRRKIYVQMIWAGLAIVKHALLWHYRWKYGTLQLVLTHSRTKALLVIVKPQSADVATALRPLHDWQFPTIAEVATRSPIGPGEVAEKSATDRGPRCDQISRSQVFVLAKKPGCDWFGRRQVPAKSPTSPRSVAD